MKVYKLRDKTTGLYSRGGYYGGTSVEGKTWSSLKNLKSHLRMRFTKYAPEQGGYVMSVPDKWEVVEGTFEPVGTVVMLAKDLL